MNNNDDKKTKEDNNSKSKLFWDLFITGGWSSFEKEWNNSKSVLHTILMFLVPIVTVGVIVLLAIVASN